MSRRRRTQATGPNRLLFVEPLAARQLLAGVPELLKDIVPDDEGSFPLEFVDVQDETFFVANDTELWKTDGTTAGTVQVKDTGAGVGPTSIADLHDHLGTLVFARVDQGSDSSFFNRSDDRLEIWKSDGTEAGTVLVKDFGVGGFGGSEGVYFTSTRDGTLFASVGTNETGIELWKSDLTEQGTEIVRDINPGSDGSGVYGMVKFNDLLIFSANDGEHGTEIWRSDGTEAGTMMIKDVDPTTGNYGGVGSYPRAYPNGFAILGDYLFFGARNSGADGEPFNDDDTGQLWKTDGTEAGTELVKDFGPGSNAGGQLVVLGDKLLGTVRTEDEGMELWRSDGTEAGTVIVKDIFQGKGDFGGYSSYPSYLTRAGNAVFFSADDGTNGTELWKSDGTENGTVMVKDIHPSDGEGSNPYSLVAAGRSVYFAADDGVHGSELWKSDGSETGTVLVKDINPIVDSGVPEGSYIYPLALANGMLFLGADDGTHGREPWMADVFPWHNNSRPTDVSGEGDVTPRDALLVINYLNANTGDATLPDPGDDEPPPYLDVNQDTFATPVDALLVVNELNAASAGEGEATSVGAAPTLDRGLVAADIFAADIFAADILTADSWQPDDFFTRLATTTTPRPPAAVEQERPEAIVLTGEDAAPSPVVAQPALSEGGASESLDEATHPPDD